MYKLISDNLFVVTRAVDNTLTRLSDNMIVNININDKHIIIDEFIVNKGYRNKGKGSQLLRELRQIAKVYDYALIIYPITGHTRLFNRNKKWLSRCNLIANTDTNGFIFYSNIKLATWTP